MEKSKLIKIILFSFVYGINLFFAFPFLRNVISFMLSCVRKLVLIYDAEKYEF